MMDVAALFLFWLLCVMSSATSSVITIFTELYSKSCALWMDTAYAIWCGGLKSFRYCKNMEVVVK